VSQSDFNLIFPKKILNCYKNQSMELFRADLTKNTPEIRLDPGGKIRIRGRSIHENTVEFFAPVEAWVDNYIMHPAEITSVDIALDYFNSATTKILISILQKITYVGVKQKKYVINWFYEEGDEDILERGEYFASILDIQINFVRIRATS